MDSLITELKTFHLKNGRKLAYLDFGPKDKKTIFYLHGFPGSRIEALFIKQLSNKIRIISPDRPGMGLSSFQKNRRILDFTNDLLELADHLDIKEFSVIGGSGGGPYAYGCAFKIPIERLRHCFVVSGLGPYNISKQGMNKKSKNTLFMAKHFPWLIRFVLWLSMARNVQNDSWWEKNYIKLYDNVPYPDQLIIKDPNIKEIMIEKSKEAYKNGAKGPSHDFNLYAKNWGFDLQNITRKVHLFHGEQDINVPIIMAKEISKTIPDCDLVIYPDEGHLSTLVNKTEDILTKFGLI